MLPPWYWSVRCSVLWVCYLAFSSINSSTVRCPGLLSIIENMSQLFRTLVCYWEPMPVRKDSRPLLGFSACDSASKPIIGTPVPCSNAKSVLGNWSWFCNLYLESLVLFIWFWPWERVLWSVLACPVLDTVHDAYCGLFMRFCSRSRIFMSWLHHGTP